MVLRGRSCLRNRAEAERGRACCLCCYAAGSRGRTIVLPKFLPRFCRLIRANHSGGYYTAKTEGNSRGNPLRSEGKEINGYCVVQKVLQKVFKQAPAQSSADEIVGMERV